MQIQPTGAANTAAGSVSQATSKDRATAGQLDPAQVMASAHIERVARSEASSADRDAQGGGQGLGHRSHPDSPDELDATGTPPIENTHITAPEPPSELDIVG